MYCILSIEGGGVRGIIPATILNKLEQEIQRISNNPTLVIGDVFDLVAGTSCGAILTCLYTIGKADNTGKIGDKSKLAPKYSANEVLGIFKRNIPEIFVKTILGRIWEGPEYSSDGLSKIATEIAAEIKINELVKPIFVPVYDMNAGNPVYFSTHFNSDYRVKDVIKAATAAPTFFAPVALTSPENEPLLLIDGGVIMNNPSYAALLNALDKLKTLPPKKRPETIIMVSISCGANNDKYTNVNRWGKISWICPIINISIDMNAEIVHNQLLQIFDLCADQEDYFRFDPPLKEGSGALDDINPKNLEGLEKDALNYVNIPEVKAKIENLAKILANRK